MREKHFQPYFKTVSKPETTTVVLCVRSIILLETKQSYFSFYTKTN